MNDRFKPLFFAAIFIVINGWQAVAQAGTLAEIQQRRKVVIAVKNNLPPLGFRDRNRNLQGLEIDIARKLAEEIFADPAAVELIPVVNQDRLKVVIDGTVDLTIAKVTITPNRLRVVDFSRHYYLDSTGIVTDRPNIIKTGDLVGKKVAVLNNSSTIAALQYITPQAKLIGVDSYQQAQAWLSAGKVVAVAADRSVLLGWTKTQPNYRVLPEKLSIEAVGIVMPKGTKYQSLRDVVDRAIGSWQASGWLEQRIRYWGLN